MLTLEIFYKGIPTREVPEYSELELRLTNQSTTPIKGAWLELAGRKLKENINLSAGSGWSVGWNVDDLVGELAFCARTAAAATTASVTVIPQKLNLEDVLYIKLERLPTLLTRLDAPNALKLHYKDENTPAFIYYSADYTAERLRFFSSAFLEKGLAENLVDRLDYATPARTESGSGIIRGAVRWPDTISEWLNRPEGASLRHYWNTAPKDFLTLPNLLFCRFQLELARELGKVVRMVRTGAPASARLKAILPELEERATTHLALLDNPHLAPLREAATLLPPNDPEVTQSCLMALNTGYSVLYRLWEQFVQRFVSLPENEEALAQSGLQPMNKIYELWAACEVAAALNLQYSGEEMELASATFTGDDFRLYYNQGVRGGWYSATRAGTARPDLRLERVTDGQQVFLDVKYRVYTTPQGENRANPDDVYKLLAYMNDFGIKGGGIIFPGNTAASVITDQKGQKLLELPLRPPLTESPETFAAALRKSIADLF